MEKFFLEIGCWDGKHISNSYELEKQGWKGVCVDPFPFRFEGRTCTLIQKAIASISGLREFVKVTIDRRNGGDVSYFSGFRDSIDHYWPLIKEHCDYEIINVDCITFDMLPLPSYIDYMSLDTEGSEVEILQSIDFSKYSFGKIMVEHNGDYFRKGYIETMMKKRGYRISGHTAIDDIYTPENVIC